MSLLDSDFLSTLQAFAPHLVPQNSALQQSALAAMAQQQPQQSSFGNLGDALARIAAGTNGAESLQKYDMGQVALQQNQSAMKALADAQAQGVTDPMQLAKAISTTSPSALKDYVEMYSKNPLSFMMQGGSGGGTGTPVAALTGDALLQALPPAIASTVKGYAEGKIPFTPQSLRSSQGQQMLQLVNQYDPNFDAVNYNARAKTRADFTSGKSAQNITAMNTAMGHLDSLNTDFSGLDNGSLPWWNKIANTLGVATGNEKLQTATTNVATDASAVASEMAKVFRSSGMSEKDIDEWRDKISTAATPAQQKAVTTKAIELLNSRLDALGEQYNQGMGTTKQGIELLSPKAQAAYAKLTGKSPNETGVTGNMAADHAAGGPKITTQADIQAAAQKTGKTIEQVTKDAMAKGYKIQ